MSEDEKKINQPEDKEPETDEEILEAKKQTSLAKEAAAQADAQNAADQAKVEMELRAKNLTDLKAYEDYLKVQKIETDKYCEEKIAEANAQKAVAEQKEAEAKDLLIRVKARDVEVNKRREEAVRAEQSAEDIKKECNGWFSAMVYQEDYHRTHIIPCRQAIDKARKAIYNLAEAIEPISKIDCAPTYNHLGKLGRELDLYMDNTAEGIPDGVKKIAADYNAEYEAIERRIASINA